MLVDVKEAPRSYVGAQVLPAVSLLTHKSTPPAIDPDLDAFIHEALDEDMLIAYNSHTKAALHHPAPLNTFGLALNTEVNVLICTTCETGLIPTEWMGHLKANHSKAFKQLKQQCPTEFENMPTTIAGFALSSPQEAAQQLSGRPPVEGIKIQTGFLCPVVVDGSPCGGVAGTLSSFATHLSSKHTAADIKPSPDERTRHVCDYQTIFAGKHKRLFRIRTGFRQALEIGPYELFLTGVKVVTPGAAQTEDIQTRELPSLLRVTHWDVFVGPFRHSPKDVVELVEFPSSRHAIPTVEEKKLCLLHEVSKSWLNKIYDVWRVSSPSVRRILGTACASRHLMSLLKGPTDRKHRDDSYWNWVETDEAEDAYTRTLTSFIAACTRSQNRGDDRCRLPLNVHQLGLIATLSDTLQSCQYPLKDHELESLVTQQQELFFSLVTNTNSTAADNQFACPVQCFIAAGSYNGDDTFKAPHSMTSILAQWQFLLRATGLYGAHLHTKAGGSMSILQCGHPQPLS